VSKSLSWEIDQRGDATGDPMRALLSSSGGKDSLMAFQRAKQQGLDIKTIVTMFDETGQRSRSHGISPELSQAQAQSLGCVLVMPSASWSDYETTFVGTLKRLAGSGHTHAVFGDIDLQPHRDWEEKVCALSNIEPVLPLWGQNRVTLSTEAIAIGLDAIVVCVDSKYLGDEFAGRRYDESFLADLPDGVDWCGENGEFHTFVTNAPFMATPLSVHVTDLRPFTAPPNFGGGRYCFAELALA
jgi:uncharacterized protein (TIGR00290 family)